MLFEVHLRRGGASLHLNPHAQLAIEEVGAVQPAQPAQIAGKKVGRFPKMAATRAGPASTARPRTGRDTRRLSLPDKQWILDEPSESRHSRLKAKRCEKGWRRCCATTAAVSATRISFQVKVTR
jgi:hypothetical protein